MSSPTHEMWNVMGAWYDKADRLIEIERNLSSDVSFDLPTIVCVGEESSGKSSTLERLAGFKFFPTDRRLCTRLPIELCIRYCPEEELEEEFRENGKVMMELKRASNSTLGNMEGGPLQTSEVEARVVEWMEEIVRQNNNNSLIGVCDDALIIKLYSPRKLNVTLIDLPGIVGGNIRNEPADMMEKTREIASSYLQKEHTIVVAVVPSTDQRIRNSQAYELVQRHHKEERCVGALTMADLCEDRRQPNDPFWLLKERLEGTADDLLELSHGYIALKNRDSSGASANLALSDVNIVESTWFQQHLPGHQDKCGIDALITKLANLIDDYTSNIWIHAEVARLRSLRADTQSALHALGRVISSLEELLTLHKDRFNRELRYWDIIKELVADTNLSLNNGQHRFLLGTSTHAWSHPTKSDGSNWTFMLDKFTTNCGWNRLPSRVPLNKQESSQKINELAKNGALVFIGEICSVVVEGKQSPVLLGTFTSFYSLIQGARLLDNPSNLPSSSVFPATKASNFGFVLDNPSNLPSSQFRINASITRCTLNS